MHGTDFIYVKRLTILPNPQLEENSLPGIEIGEKYKEQN